jgi:ADP-ribosylglycohydrolase
MSQTRRATGDSDMMAAMRVLLLVILLLAPSFARAVDVEIREDILEDKIRGGMLGQILGNLNGLPHEMKYIAEPGNVANYIPSLPNGARTDDDTDIEWVYLLEMQKTGKLLIPQDRITELWKRHINRSIWCSNLYARHLMDLGIEPPLTGNQEINPWSCFNISGSFLAETWGLACPGMPQTAAEIGLNLTHVAIDGEPAQTTQFVTTMISMAYFENDIEKIIDAGLSAIDRQSEIPGIVADVRGWHRENQQDWRATRLRIRDKYTRFDGEMADRNGYALNTAATVAALLYGRGDFRETMRMAFNFGWDADNNAATGGAIVGVIKGRAWMESQGWDIRDVYKNTTRDVMPNDETISGYSTRLVEVARQAIVQNGGKQFKKDQKSYYRIRLQPPKNLAPVHDPEKALPRLAQRLLPQIERDLAGTPQQQACGAYLAICVDAYSTMRNVHPEQWNAALAELQKNAIVKDLFAAPRPQGPVFQRRAIEAGLQKPK